MILTHFSAAVRRVCVHVFGRGCHSGILSLICDHRLLISRAATMRNHVRRLLLKLFLQPLLQRLRPLLFFYLPGGLPRGGLELGFSSTLQLDCLSVDISSEEKLQLLLSLGHHLSLVETTERVLVQLHRAGALVE